MESAHRPSVERENTVDFDRGQMVMLHGLENGVASPRVSVDIDAVVNLRLDPKGLKRLVNVLKEFGLRPADMPGPDGHMHRYVKPQSGLGDWRLRNA